MGGSRAGQLVSILITSIWRIQLVWPARPERGGAFSSTGADSVPLCLKRERKGGEEQGEEHGALRLSVTWDEEEQGQAA